MSAEKLAEALRAMIDPIPYLERKLPEGYRLDGHAALRQINSREFYINLAKEALAAHEAEAKAAPADSAVLLWQAMNEAEKVGNRTDDKLIVEFLRRAGYVIAAAPVNPSPTPAPLTDEQIDAMAHKEGDYDERTCCWSFNGDTQCRYNLTNFARAIERAHGIGGKA
jgi:hypothetical protein